MKFSSRVKVRAAVYNTLPLVDMAANPVVYPGSKTMITSGESVGFIYGKVTTRVKSLEIAALFNINMMMSGIMFECPGDHATAE